MTPQEQQLVAELFDRLARLENTPRDGEAERLIADGAQRAPHALYALVQTALVQDEALKRASARIEALEAELAGHQQPQQQQGSFQGSFLDSMRDAVFGRETTRGSVPAVQPRSAPPPYQAQPAYPAGPAFAPGGSFLGTAASAAAGVIGGGLLLDGIRSMFSHQSGSAGRDPFASTFPGTSSGTSASDTAPPWRGNAADSDLARAAGIDDIGRSHIDPAASADNSDLIDTPDEETIADNDFGDVDSSTDSYDV
jgi:uncharacterized protein